MSQKPKPILDDMHGALPMLAYDDSVKAIEFYKKAFGATEVMPAPKSESTPGLTFALRVPIH